MRYNKYTDHLTHWKHWQLRVPCALAAIALSVWGLLFGGPANIGLLCSALMFYVIFPYIPADRRQRDQDRRQAAALKHADRPS